MQALKWSKCKFMESNVEYLGHILNGKSLHPSDQKVEAIIDFSASHMKLNFIITLKYSTAMEYLWKIYGLFMLWKPMYTLLKKESPWKWRAQCEEAFVKSKRFLIQSETVVPYDATKPLRLACDTYPFAVVAIVSQRESPLASHMLETIMQK